MFLFCFVFVFSPPDDAKFDSRMNMQMYTQALSGLQQLYEELRHQGVQVRHTKSQLRVDPR